jgi:thioredoxin 1
MANVASVTDATFAAEVEQSDKLTVVDFTASWCGPCRIIAPILEQIAEQHADNVKVVKLDVDENQQTTSRYGVRSMPTLMFFKGGQAVGQIAGAVPRQHIEQAIAQLS